jgi:AsmA protein
MQEIDSIPAQIPQTSEESLAAAEQQPRRRLSLFNWRYVLVYLLLAGLVGLALLPPLVNVNRYKRRIVTSIGASIGRPVHLDKVSLLLLPFPGFKLENFVVEEDPSFGAEPVIRANTVVATLRVSSLWRRKVEFSRINFQDPSINLVHMPSEGSHEGRWNVESILLQAARIPAAPTAQAKAGPDPRFPYIEATGARVNIKYGDEKLPFSLTEADFALWLPRPQQWHIRLEAKPTRTDTSASDTGTVSLEGTLDRAERFDLIPIELSGEWRDVPLGEASRVVLGHDAGLRGELRLSATVHGTIGNNVLKTTLQLSGARRAEFVPPQLLDLRAECQATAAETFHALHQIRCSWPPPTAPSTLALTADLADIHRPETAPFQIGTPGLPASTLLDWLRIASPRVSPDVTATGTLAGSISRGPVSGEVGDREGRQGLSGRLALSSATITGGPIGDTEIVLGDLVITSSAAEEPQTPSRRRSRRKTLPAANQPVAGGFSMSPATITLGGKDPATLEGRFDRDGYSLHLTGNVLASRLLALGSAVPQFGDGLAAVLPGPVVGAAAQTKELPIHIDLTSSRVWGGGQSWAKPVRPTVRKRR